AAIRNNVIGTYNLINNAIRHRVPRLIMLSTDKAVNPASIMGVSKRVAELMMLALSSPQCRLTSVRLGNVLGTQGSVVPRFEEQIRRREPVTVTHPDAARFFMTADGAVELVLAAAWLGTGGDILVPDLGEPIRIIDLANTMIDAAGLDPGCQPSITFTGLRPGEKIREELFTDAEQDFPDALSNVTRVTAPAMPGSQVHTLIGEISDLAAASDLRNLIAKLREIVPEYQPNDVLTGILPCLAVT
ncbi:MAG TPA: polysaccharide biosynthesis protein, partial [Blastocatellia bacterium]|nr:polysaccharide biosynthesis protein [Blastocatellia bacterium]